MVARTLGRFAWVALLAAFAAGCGGNHYTNPFQPVPSGTITLTFLGGNGQPLVTTAKSPVLVHNSFTLVPNEPGYSDYFSARIVSYTAPTTEPCYIAPHAPSNTTLIFKPREAPPLSGKGGSPCFKAGTKDVEGIRVSDTNGHSTMLYIEDGP